jgi:hypothetical protein
LFAIKTSICPPEKYEDERDATLNDVRLVDMEEAFMLLNGSNVLAGSVEIELVTT